MQEIFKQQYLKVIKKSCTDNAVVELMICTCDEGLEGFLMGTTRCTCSSEMVFTAQRYLCWLKNKQIWQHKQICLLLGAARITARPVVAMCVCSMMMRGGSWLYWGAPQESPLLTETLHLLCVHVDCIAMLTEGFLMSCYCQICVSSADCLFS